jgi:hypothetical protein
MQRDASARPPTGRGSSSRARGPRRSARLAAAILCALPCGAGDTMLRVAPALALEDRDICVLAQQLAAAAEKDIGIWIDRATRNAGMRVSCATRTIEYRRFTYTLSAAMTEAWKTRKADDWNATHCGSPIWRDAILGGWRIILNETAADGGQVQFTARCT